MHQVRPGSRARRVRGREIAAMRVTRALTRSRLSDDLHPRGADSEDEDSVADTEHGSEVEDAVAGELQDGVVSAEDLEDVSSRPG